MRAVATGFLNVARIAALVAATGAALGTAAPARAEGLMLGRVSSKSRAAQFARQTQLMDSRLAAQYQRSQRLRPDAGGRVRTVTIINLDGRIASTGGMIPRYSGNQRSKYLPHARAMARKHGVPLYSFFLEGVAGNAAMFQADWRHPNARGVEVIVRRMAPVVRRALL